MEQPVYSIHSGLIGGSYKSMRTIWIFHFNVPLVMPPYPMHKCTNIMPMFYNDLATANIYGPVPLLYQPISILIETSLGSSYQCQVNGV